MGSLSTGITNSQGLAEITVSNITGTVSFTASYSNVTDTCTVTGVSYLFYDACDSASGLTNYGTPRNSRNNYTYSATLTLTDNSYYTVTQNTNNANGYIPITPITGLEDIKITMETYTPSGGNTGIGLVIWNSTSERLALTIQDDGYLFRVSLINGSTIDRQIISLGLANKWVTQVYTIDSTNNQLTLELYDDTDALVYTYTDTLNIINSNTVYGINRQWSTGDARIRNIKAEAL